MKIKLTPQLCYLIGLWKEAKTQEGIGVRGPEELQSEFVKAAMENKVAEAGKILTGEGTVYFYHSAYRKFFQKVIEEELERFKYKNEYSANFFAGLFDAFGGITREGKVYLAGLSQADEMVLYRLGFNTIKRKGARFIRKPASFLIFIKPFTRLHRSNPIFESLKPESG